VKIVIYFPQHTDAEKFKCLMVKETINHGDGQLPDTMQATEMVNEGAKIKSFKWGERFHGLFVHCLLGEGAMGVAYLASHPTLKIPLIIKLFKFNPDANIFKEAHLAARVVSPNIVGVIDAGVEKDIPFVVQRYVDGIDLAELINHLQRAQRRLPVDAVCRIIIDAATGLHAIHQAGVIHRDIKPANLFLCGNGVATVGDFGIAVDAIKDEASFVGGTPVFMAPELWLNQKVGRYTDVYALGATAHLLATGRLPFEAKSLGELQSAHLNQQYVPPTTNEPIDAYLFSVIERTLRKKPEERFHTTEALARTLRVIAKPMPQFVQTAQDEAQAGDIQVKLRKGNIIDYPGDVIVNAANTELVMDVGVAYAISRAAGASVEKQAIVNAPVSMGDVVWTEAGNLNAKWVAHAVAAWNGAVCLQRCTLRVLLEADSREAESVIFPSLGTGIGDVPMDLAAKLMLESIQTFASLAPENVRRIEIVLFDEQAYERWQAILNGM
jgi:O-acetyl-ADP-ribose deacetylase (regulator of RNase III)